ncbi:hypothetical protein TrST_g11755 [Triparma strigata]|uniref:Uncharacterized protein n=1 Tax=Triparma strigata TaxID=1606541 RepID=A0A9W7EKG4_9STRA|nr:hypothetical protein TrST_g11755 [Triparma strigata]
MIHPTPSSLAKQLPPAVEKRMEEVHGDLSKRTHFLLADLLATLPMTLEQVESLDAIEQNLKGEGDNDVVKDVEAEIRAAFIKAFRYSAKQREDKRDMKEERTMEKRDALASVEEGVKALASIQELNKQNEEIRSLGVDPRTFMDFGVTVSAALQKTSVIMMKLVAIVIIFSLVIWTFINAVRGAVNGINDPMEKNRIAVSSLFAWACTSWFMFWSLTSFFHGLNKPFIYVRNLVVCAGFYLVVKSYFWLSPEIPMHNLLASAVSIACGAAGVVLFVNDWINENQDDEGVLKDRVAFKRAKALLKGEADFTRMSGSKKWKSLAILSIPIFFIYGVILGYIIAIFGLFQAFDSVTWKLFVTLVAFVLKVAGNKVMLKLVAGQRVWVADSLLFSYEFATALLLRVLQMSLPDEHTAQLVGLVGAVGEVCVRIFFFNLYLKAGLQRSKQGMTLKEQHAYAAWGKLRVQDGSNDMLVEYLSSISSSMFLIMLAPLDSFDLATTTEISQRTVLIITAYQVVPELFLDFYVTFMETFCGLSKLHENYWDPKAGGDPRSSITVGRWGDLVKSLVLELVGTIVLITVILVATVK